MCVRSGSHWFACTASALALAGPCGTSLGQASFVPLAIPAGFEPFSDAFGVCGNGAEIVGYTTSPTEGAVPIRWCCPGEAGEVMRVIDSGSPVVVPGAAYDAGRSGTIVGSGGWDGRGFEWTGTTVQWLSGASGTAAAVSDDGAVIFGAVGSTPTPCVWRSGVRQPLPLPGGLTRGFVEGCSGNGSVAVGAASAGTFTEGRGVKWTLSAPGGTYTQTLIAPLGGATGISACGSVVVGFVSEGKENTRVVWRRDEPALPVTYPLESPDGYLELSAASRRGARVVGLVSPWGEGGEALLWTPRDGARLLRDVLETDYQVALDGWFLASANAISDDGRVIVGMAVRSSPYELHAYRVELPVTCVSDWNFDGTVNSTDVSDMINEWFLDQVEGTTASDVDGNGVVNSTDVSEYINAWFEDVAECG